MTGASSSTAASTTARAISRLLQLKEGTANRFSKTYLRNDRGLVTNISFCRVSEVVDRMVERNLAVLREKKKPSLFELMTNKSGVSNSFCENTNFCSPANPEENDSGPGRKLGLIPLAVKLPLRVKGPPNSITGRIGPNHFVGRWGRSRWIPHARG